MSYLVCDKCGGYYELQLGESPENFTDKCECGGHLRYIPNLNDESDLNKICPNCGILIEDNEVCPTCGFGLKKLHVNEKKLILGILNTVFAISFLMMGFLALVYMLWIAITPIFNPQPITNFYSYLLILLITFMFPIVLLVVIIAFIRRFKSIYLKWYEKKNLNWAAIVIAFMITLIIGSFGGRYLPSNVSLVGPLIGGFIAGCIAGKSYIKGLVNGGLPAGIAGFIGVPLIALLFKGELPILINNSPEMILFLVSIGVIVYFIIFFILGSIGGIIGAGIRKRINSSKDTAKEVS